MTTPGRTRCIELSAKPSTLCPHRLSRNDSESSLDLRLHTPYAGSSDFVGCVAHSETHRLVAHTVLARQRLKRARDRIIQKLPAGSDIRFRFLSSLQG